MPNRIGLTAHLNVRYKAPTTANQFLVFRTSCNRVEGRKAWAVGTIETLDGKVLVEADALYIEPKVRLQLADRSISEENADLQPY